MYAKLFERRRGVQSAYDRGGGGGGGGGGAVGKSHSLLKHKEHHGKRVHSAPALSCSTASLTFVRTTELSGLLSMAQHVICRSLSSGRGGGGGAAKAARGRHFIRDGGGGGAAAPPPPPPPRLCWIRGCWLHRHIIHWFMASTAVRSSVHAASWTLLWLLHH